MKVALGSVQMADESVAELGSGPLTVAAALLTPLLFSADYVLASSITYPGVRSGLHGLGGIAAPLALIGLILGICLWRRIRRVLYFVILVLFSPMLWLLFGEPAPGNYTGLFIVLTFLGVLAAGVISLVFAFVARHWNYPDWVPTAAIVIALLFPLGGQVVEVCRTWQLSRKMTPVVQNIRQAEEGYAERNAYHAYTCDASGLSRVNEVSWRGGDDRVLNGEADGYEIRLACTSSPYPNSFWVEVGAKRGPWLFWDSKSATPEIRP